MRILVAEDDPVSSLILISKLKRLGHEVIAAQDGGKAWDAYRLSAPDLVITDWMMPTVDGLELCRLIRAHERLSYTYVIMLTALGGKESYLEGMNAGADDFVTKPVDSEGLKARLRVAERVLNLQSTVDRLEGLLPICAYCKKVRDTDNVWHPVEDYLGSRTDTEFRQALCPNCANGKEHAS